MESTDAISEFLSITNTSDREDALLFLQHSNDNLEVFSYIIHFI